MMNDKNGASAAQILVQDGQYAMVGHTVSFGYREFKNSGDYQNDVISMVFVPIGEQAGAGSTNEEWTYTDDNRSERKDVREFATFMIDSDVFTLPASAVVEAVAVSRMHSASTLKPLAVGVLDYQDSGTAQSSFVPVVDMRYLLRSRIQGQGGLNEIIIVRHGKHKLGLLVTRLHDILEFNSNQIEPPLQLFHGHAGNT